MEDLASLEASKGSLTDGSNTPAPNPGDQTDPGDSGSIKAKADKA